MPPSMLLSEGHLGWFIVDAVVDVRGFYAAYRSDGWGARPKVRE